MHVWQRDFVGYGSRPPKVEWPDGKRLALQIAINYEAAGERNVLFGDKGPEIFGGEMPGYGPITDRDLDAAKFLLFRTTILEHSSTFY